MRPSFGKGNLMITKLPDNFQVCDVNAHKYIILLFYYFIILLFYNFIILLFYNFIIL
jgi:hypothetical protein